MDAVAGRDVETGFGCPLAEVIVYAYRFAYRLTGGHPADAEDLLQEGLLRVLARLDLGHLSAVENPMSYLYKVIHNLHRDRLRRPQPYGGLSDAEADTQRDLDDPPDELAVLALRRSSVTKAIERLSHDHRTVIRLIFDEGMTRREVARALGVSPDTVKSRVAAAQKHLRGILWTERAD
jgi:RNA polymerase sigma-70 factor (ECF subfamily)